MSYDQWSSDKKITFRDEKDYLRAKLEYLLFPQGSEKPESFLEFIERGLYNRDQCVVERVQEIDFEDTCSSFLGVAMEPAQAGSIVPVITNGTFSTTPTYTYYSNFGGASEEGFYILNIDDTKIEIKEEKRKKLTRFELLDLD